MANFANFYQQAATMSIVERDNAPKWIPYFITVHANLTALFNTAADYAYNNTNRSLVFCGFLDATIIKSF